MYYVPVRRVRKGEFPGDVELFHRTRKNRELCRMLGTRSDMRKLIWISYYDNSQMLWIQTGSPHMYDEAHPHSREIQCAEWVEWALVKLRLKNSIIMETTLVDSARLQMLHLIKLINNPFSELSLTIFTCAALFICMSCERYNLLWKL